VPADAHHHALFIGALHHAAGHAGTALPEVSSGPPDFCEPDTSGSSPGIHLALNIMPLLMGATML